MNTSNNIKNSWLRLIVFIGLWIGTMICSFIPVAFVYPEIENYELYQQNDSIFILITSLALLASVFSAIYLMVIKIEKRKLSDYKLNFNISELAQGIVIGTLIIFSFDILVTFVLNTRTSFAQFTTMTLTFLFYYLFVAIIEEVVFRGYVLQNLSERLNIHLALFICSILFGLSHFFNDHFTLIGFINISISGYLMGYAFIKSKTISMPIGIHWAWNFIQGPISGFNVSGNVETGVISMKIEAPDFISGGQFGAEGSLLLTPIILASLYLINKIYQSA